MEDKIGTSQMTTNVLMLQLLEWPLDTMSDADLRAALTTIVES